MNFYESVLPVIVLYNQDITSSKGVETLIKTLDASNSRMKVFVYDNSKYAQYEGDFIYKKLDVSYVHDSTNSGVSKAYNSGASYARLTHKKWLLLLDQDTLFPDHFMGRYDQAVVENPGAKLIVPVLRTQYKQILSPCRYIHKKGRWLDDVEEGFMDSNLYSPVNSGMLIDLDAFEEAGGYNEKVKLDFADFQFIERFSKKNRSFYVMDMQCIQDFSGFENDKQKLKHRFYLFCDSARNCQKNSASDHFWYFIVVTRRMASLTLKHVDPSFIGIWISKYIL
ncbi:glycosyltransferase, putative [Arcticibacter svalbardensis MN12-7]|uniref:Glycosyltransferase, putative n=1 Tax=Arcticibacter svalbardensis MN12-7 TaxID=1150600 RepID=R9GR44_9SPHI|nr:glycosyltransferase [Arcticibacter svalbardensis]EOR94025.1 glycosyltransferase, putative [Arcticibacter svalbardensis MN12-7]